MAVKFDKSSLESLSASIKARQADVDQQVKSLLSAATRDPSGWDGSSGQRYDHHLKDWGDAQNQLDTAMTSMAKVIDNMISNIDDIDTSAMR